MGDLYDKKYLDEIERLENALLHEKGAFAAKESVINYMREEAKRRKDETDLEIAALRGTIELYRKDMAKDKEQRDIEFAALRRVAELYKNDLESLRNDKRSQFEAMLQAMLMEPAEGRTPEEKYKLMEVIVLSQIATEVGNIRLIIEKRPVPT